MGRYYTVYNVYYTLYIIHYTYNTIYYNKLVSSNPSLLCFAYAQTCYICKLQGFLVI